MRLHSEHHKGAAATFGAQTIAFDADGNSLADIDAETVVDYLLAFPETLYLVDADGTPLSQAAIESDMTLEPEPEPEPEPRLGPATAAKKRRPGRPRKQEVATPQETEAE